MEQSPTASIASVTSNVEQVLHPTVTLETETDSYLLTKLVTFVLLMVWLVFTSAAYYLRAFVAFTLTYGPDEISSNPTLLLFAFLHIWCLFVTVKPWL